MEKSKGDKSVFPYAGRWVARVRGKIVAQGETAEQASVFAQLTRPKEIPEIVFIPTREMLFDIPIITIILEILPSDQSIYLVGGAVRDILLRRETHDLDFVVPLDGIRIARRVANALNGAFYPLDSENDVGRVILTNADGSQEILDFSSYRDADLESDLRARDFSINSLAVNLRSRQVIDPLGGMDDLRRKRLRASSNSSIIDDPVRLLRAVRLALELGFTIHSETRTLMKESAGLLSQISPERLRDELFKILDGPKPSKAIQALDILGALPYIIPEVLELKGVRQSAPHVHDVWTHTLKAMDYLESILNVVAEEYESDRANDLLTGMLSLKLGRFRHQFVQHFSINPGSQHTPRALLFFSVLYHDIAKPKKKKIEDGKIVFHGHDEEGGLLAVKRAIKLRLSNAEMNRIRKIIKNHMRIVNHIKHLEDKNGLPTRRAIYRFFRETGDSGVDLCLLALADKRATYDSDISEKTWSASLEVVRLLLENWWEKREESIAPPLLLNGDDLVESLNLAPGPKIGKILEIIREAQATGKVTSREEAIAIAKNWLSDHPGVEI